MGNYKTTHIEELYSSLGLSKVPLQYQGLLYARLHDKVRRELDKLRKDGQVPQWRTATGVWKARWPEPARTQMAEETIQPLTILQDDQVPQWRTATDVWKPRWPEPARTQMAEETVQPLAILENGIPAPVPHPLGTPTKATLRSNENAYGTTVDTENYQGEPKSTLRNSRHQAIGDAAKRRFAAASKLARIESEALAIRLAAFPGLEERGSRAFLPELAAMKQKQVLWHSTNQQLEDARTSFHRGIRALYGI
ncbi:hypothetical protein PG984_011218 [Apiospora sp. TS-2023a]